MRTLGINVFILSENALVATGLKKNLESRFDHAISVQPFYDVKSMLKKMDNRIDVLILDELVDGEKGSEIIKAAKALCPDLACVYHTTQDEVAHCLETLMAEEQFHAVQQLSYSFNPRVNEIYARR